MSKITHIAAIAGLAAVLAGPAFAASAKNSDYQRNFGRNGTEAGQTWQNPDRNFYSEVPGSQHDFQLEGR